MQTQSLTHGFWYYNWGNAASVVGLFVSCVGIGISVWTLITAKSAKKAATEAKNAANSRLLADEIRRGEVLSRELSSLSMSGSYSQAALRAKDVQDLLGWILAYWTKELESEWRNDLLESKNEAEQIEKIMRKLFLETDISEKELARTATRINNVFVGFQKTRASIEKNRS